jgi:hypothetical protein
LLTVVAVLLLATGCENPLASPDPDASPPPLTIERPAAASAGGACQLLDYTVVEQAIGVRFEVAAAAQQDATYTCVLQQAAASLPDLLLVVTSSNVDTSIFRNTMTPRGAAAVAGLGKVGYRITGTPGPGRGPIVEVGWLSGNNRLMTLRFTTIAGTTPAAATETGLKLVELAKKVDQTTV